MTPPPDPPEYVTVTPWGTSHGSLWNIAEDMFEDGGRWRDIYAENRALIGDDPARLRPGMRLRLPTMEIHPGYIRAVAGDLTAEGDDILGRLDEARKRLAEIGDFWGGDAMGVAFSAGADGRPGYASASADAVSGAEALAACYRVIALGLREMADRTDDTEWENIARILAASVQPPGR